MRYLIPLLLFVAGCDNRIKYDSNIPLPHCDGQFTRMEACMKQQFKHIPCGREDFKILSDQTWRYCEKESLANDFKQNCSKVAKEKVPYLMKSLLEDFTKRCVVGT